MKIKKGYILRKVAGSSIVVPVGKLDFDGIITLNETGVFIWNMLTKGAEFEEIIKAMLNEYNVSEDILKADLTAFIEKIKNAGIIEE